MIEIQDNQALAELCQCAGEQEFITLDTEFIRERTYYPILALVQMSWLDRTPVLIDPLKITDWKPLHRILLDPKVVKIFHAGRQDLEIFYQQMNDMPVNLFDSQIAASMCGFGDQVGYSALVERLTGVQLVKGSSYTNWLQRPLSEAQLSYARDDVLYLPALYRRLVKIATDKKRLDWVTMEMTSQLNRKLFEPEPSELWRKVKRVNSLRSRNLPVIQDLTLWRYDLARLLDKPLRYVLSDEVLVELAKVEQLTLEQLRTRRGIQSRVLERYGKEIVAAHTKSRQRPKEDWPILRQPNDKPLSPRSEALSEIAWMLVKEIARGADMAPTHLSNKKELAYFIEALHRKADLTQFEIGKGWRWAMAGQPLIDLIEGRLVIRVKNRQMYWDQIEPEESP